MESLQLAQMLADLSSLNAALLTVEAELKDSQAATALVTANKDLHKPEALKSQTDLLPPDLKRTMSSGTPRTGSPSVMVDKYGRRMLLSPPLSRTNSAQGSHPGTPRLSDGEDEIDRANTLMALYEIRAKLKQQDNSSLLKAREKIAALAARQQAEAHDSHGSHGSHGHGHDKPHKHKPVKHYPYTYPK